MVVHHRAGAARRRSAPTRSRSATPSASRGRSRSTTSSSPRPRTSRGRSARRSTSPPPVARARCCVDIPKDIVDPKNPRSAMDWYWPSDAESSAGLPGYKPTTKGHPRKIKDAAELIVQSTPARHLRRRRHPQGAGGRGAARAGRAVRHPRGHDAHGAGRVPRRPSAVPRHAGHARQLHRGHRRCSSPTC